MQDIDEDGVSIRNIDLNARQKTFGIVFYGIVLFYSIMGVLYAF